MNCSDEWLGELGLEKEAETKEPPEFYEGVEDYDPVLRDHCRLQLPRRLSDRVVMER